MAGERRTAPRVEADRLLVKQPWRHYRRTCSRAEMRWGMAVGLGLAAVAAGVAWRGRRADPDRFGAPPPLASPAAAPGSGDRGPIPDALAGPGWTEGGVSQFDADNLYVKIDGRADYFLAYGFRRLYFLPLRGPDGATVDVEVYDLGEPANALGAFGGEHKDGAVEQVAGGGLRYLARNALFVARGPYYVRTIGSNEEPATVDQLRRIGDTLRLLMYCDAYGERDKARRLFRALPPDARRIDGVDFARAEAACPHGVRIGELMRRAARALA